MAALSRLNATGGTSEAARDLMNANGRAKTLEQLVLELVEERPATGEEMHARIQALGVRTVLYSIKPRFSALAQRGLVTDSGERGTSESGRLRSIRWRATTADERSLFAARKAAADEKGPARE